MSRPESAVPAVGAGGQLRLLVLEVDGPGAGFLALALQLVRQWCREQGCRPPEWLADLEAAARRVAVSTTGHDRGRQDTTTLPGERVAAHAAPMVPLLLTFDQAAVVLGVSRRTVERMVGDGKLPKVDVGERSPRIHRDDLEVFAESLRPERPASAADPGPDKLRGNRARFKEGA